MKYLVVLHKSKYGYDVHVPALPGCHSQGNIRKKAMANVSDAITAYLSAEVPEFKGAEVREIADVSERNVSRRRSAAMENEVAFG